MWQRHLKQQEQAKVYQESYLLFFSLVFSIHLTIYLFIYLSIYQSISRARYLRCPARRRSCLAPSSTPTRSPGRRKSSWPPGKAPFGLLRDFVTKVERFPQTSSLASLLTLALMLRHWDPEVGIYKRKQESKKTRKKELDQESDQEKTLFFSWSLSWSSSCFLVFFYKFSP